jgi:hypothetical protein
MGKARLVETWESDDDASDQGGEAVTRCYARSQGGSGAVGSEAISPEHSRHDPAASDASSLGGSGGVGPEARDALKRHFGFSGFRSGQELAVSAALRGQDALVVMAQGAASPCATSCPPSAATTGSCLSSARFSR